MRIASIISINQSIKKKFPTFSGPNCLNFDELGKCPYGIACCFARSHTNADDAELSQVEKAPDPAWKPTINSGTLALQQRLRKRNYAFTKCVWKFTTFYSIF
jgi:hypothetical protein